MSSKERKKLVFSCLISLVIERGLFNVSLFHIAKRAKCSESTVKSHFGGIVKIREHVVEYAEKNNIQKILKTPITDIINQ